MSRSPGTRFERPTASMRTQKLRPNSHEGGRWRRESAGVTPSEAMGAQRRKRNDLVGELVIGLKGEPLAPAAIPLTLLSDAIDIFLPHLRVHSPSQSFAQRLMTYIS